MSKTRTSVELHPDGCRLVEVQISASGRRAPAGDVRVTQFIGAVPAADPDALAGILGALRQERKLARHAWVTIWGLRSAQQVLRLPPAAPDALEALALRDARKELAPFQADGEGASVAVVPGSEILVGTHRRREVSLVAVSSAEVRRRIQPLVDAGFVVEGVVTPALALAALARSRRDATPATAAYVAITGRATCLAIVRDGVLLFAREMPWGHESEEVRPTPDTTDGGLNARLASEVKRSILFFKQTFRSPVEAVALCGDMPNLRTLTGPLGEGVGLPVQTLDSLVGIDAAAVPEPAEAFRADVAALRLAIAIGADAAPAANLLPIAIRKVRAAHLEVVRVAAAALVGVVLTAGWYAVASQTASHQRAERAAIERELAILEPGAAHLVDRRQAYVMTTSRQAALAAFETQGPRLARLLEVLGRSTPERIVLTGLEVQPYGAYWDVTLSGTAVGEDAAVGQEAVNTLLRGLSESPFLGAPARTPDFRVVSGGGGADNSGAAVVPVGMSGVEFTVHFEVAK